MHRWRRSAIDDAGSAALEFITVGVILLVPMIYLVVALGTIQEQILGAEAAARHIARAIAQAPDAASAAARGDVVLAQVIDEYGLDAGAVDLTLSCRPTGTECPSAGATIIVTVATRARLPLVPEILALDRSTAVPVQAQSVQKMSRLWGSE
ncbi:TadE family protein [Microbacterium sp. AGC62]|jgi:hypothetical protein|uniref:TadE family protein n=1 Tax=Microbacterium sp. NPDC087592 TaxID=3364193 RepID=UPI0037FB1263